MTMLLERPIGVPVRTGSVAAVALLFVCLLWLLALSGVVGYRFAASVTCGLLLLTRLRSWMAIAATTVASLLLLVPGTASAPAIVLQGAVFLATLLVFRAAAAGPGLSSWQSAATGVAWFLMAGPISGLPGVLLVALVLARAALTRCAQTCDAEARFAAFLGMVVAAGVLSYGRGHALGWVAWLMPAAPLLLDVMFSGLRRMRHPVGASIQVSTLVAKASGQWRVAGIVLFVLGLGWYGLAAWWTRAVEFPVLLTAAFISLPVAFAWVVVSVAAHPAPAQVVFPCSGPASRILGLDGLRAIAVTLVVLSHVGLIEGGAWEISGATRIVNANVGVQIFFVLSGLLITHLMLAEHVRHGQIDLSRFWLRRMLRIFPVYYAAIAVSFALAAAGTYSIDPLAFGAAIAYAMNFASWDYMEAIFSHFWSLAVEEHFYFFWPVVVLLVRGRSHAAGVIAAAAILVMTLWQVFPPAFVVSLASSHAVNRWTLPAALPILVGSLAACLMWQRTLIPVVVRSLGVAGMLAFLLPLVPFAQVLVPAALLPLLSSTAIAAMMAFVVYSPRSLVVRLLELRPLVYLGTISYGIYVWQGVFTGNGPYRSQPGWPPEPLVGAALAVAVAALTYRFFEEPILRYKDRLGRLARLEA